MDVEIKKQPLKVLEIPLSKFTEEVIPHYQIKYDKQKQLIHKLISEENLKDLRKELPVNRRGINQLKDLMYELDCLKTQVEDKDSLVFDKKTLQLRKSIVTLITGYTELIRLSEQLINIREPSPIEENTNPFEGANQIQILENIDDLKIKEYQEKCARVEALNDDVNALHDMYGQLNQMVQVQGEHVDDITEDIQSTSNNVNSGLKHLQVAHRLKTTAYPMTGAVIGGMIGGPIGMVAGAKVGGLAALCCAVLGYTSGKLFKNSNEELTSQLINENEAVNRLNEEKKDI